MSSTRGFQLTRPSRGATISWICFKPISEISTHTPLAGRDPYSLISEMYPIFQLTRPSRGATRRQLRARVGILRFQLTRPSRGATTPGGHPRKRLREISTHTPLAGRDPEEERKERQREKISTHTPLAGRDRAVIVTITVFRISTHTPLAGRDRVLVPLPQTHMQFQLTRPSRGATFSCAVVWCGNQKFQLTRPSRGATRN